MTLQTVGSLRAPGGNGLHARPELHRGTQTKAHAGRRVYTTRGTRNSNGQTALIPDMGSERAAPDGTPQEGESPVTPQSSAYV